MPSAERYRDETRGVWRYRGRYYDAAGRRRSSTFDTKAEALRWAGKQEDRVQRGMRSDSRAARMPWGEWADRWLEAKQAEPRTRRTDVTTVRAHVRPRWGDTPLVAITRIDVQGWVNQLARRRSASTTRKAFYALSGSLRVAVVDGILDSNPCTGVSLPTNPTGQERFLTDVEAGRILYHLSGRWRVLGELVLGTGLRMSEAAGLHVGRVDLDNLRIEVIETYDPAESGGEVRGYPKGKRRRTVPLSPELAVLLQEHLDRHPAAASCGRTHRAGRCIGGTLITGERGAPIDAHNFGDRQWRQACELAGFYEEVPDGRKRNADGTQKMRRVLTVHPHDFRHTYASRLVQQRIPLERVQLLLGHEDIKTTQRYAHLVPEDGWDEVRTALSTSLTAARAVVPDGPQDGPIAMSNETVSDRRRRRIRAV